MDGDDKGRPGFKEWLSRFVDPGWKNLPLTHIAKAVVAEDIIRAGMVKPARCDVFKRPISYFFYGRPAYRVAGDGSVKSEAACPICFIFRPEIVQEASKIFPFDSGAYSKRMYQSHMLDEMKIEDFEIEPNASEPNKLISALFSNLEDYVVGNTHNFNDLNSVAQSWEFHAKAFISLVSSQGRNEPDDRIFSVEVQIERGIMLSGNLTAVIVPHTLWTSGAATPWIKPLEEKGVKVETYTFIPNKHPEYYHAQIEAAIKRLYIEWAII